MGISGHRSTHMDELEDLPFDFVVTVCNHAYISGPLFPSRTRVVHSGFDELPRPARQAKTEEEALGHHRRVRDEIRAFVDRLPRALGAVPK